MVGRSVRVYDGGRPRDHPRQGSPVTESSDGTTPALQDSPSEVLEATGGRGSLPRPPCVALLRTRHGIHADFVSSLVLVFEPHLSVSDRKQRLFRRAAPGAAATGLASSMLHAAAPSRSGPGGGS